MNWGTKLTLGLASFMLFILGMGYFMISASQNDGLVDDNYYEQGLHFDEESAAINRVFEEGVEPQMERKEGQLQFKLPVSASYELKLLRKSNSKDDLHQQGTSLGDAHLVLLDISKLATGSYLLELKWTHNGKNYTYRKDIQI